MSIIVVPTKIKTFVLESVFYCKNIPYNMFVYWKGNYVKTNDVEHADMSTICIIKDKMLSGIEVSFSQTVVVT